MPKASEYHPVLKTEIMLLSLLIFESAWISGQANNHARLSALQTTLISLFATKALSNDTQKKARRNLTCFDTFACMVGGSFVALLQAAYKGGAACKPWT